MNSATVRKNSGFNASEVVKEVPKKRGRPKKTVGFSIVDIADKSANAKVETVYFKGSKAEATRHINPDGSIGGWVAVTAFVAPTAYVAQTASVFGMAQIRDEAQVLDNALVFGHCIIANTAIISGHANVSGGARVWGKSLVTDNAHVLGRSEILDAEVREDAYVMKYCFVTEAVIKGAIHISCPCKVSKCTIDGNHIIEKRPQLEKLFPECITK